MNLATDINTMKDVIDANPHLDARPAGTAPVRLKDPTKAGLPDITKPEADALVDVYKNWSAYKITDFNNPPPGTPKTLLNDIKTLMADPALMGLIKTGDNGLITQDGLGTMLNTVYTASLPTNDWTAISGSSPGTAQQNGALMAALQDVTSNWDAYRLNINTYDWANPPAVLSPALLADFKTITANPSFFKMLQPPGTTLPTQASCTQVLAKMTADLHGATTSFQNYLTKNPGADPASVELARQAAELMANMTMISTDLGGTANNHITQGELTYIVDNPAGFSPDLVSAAKLFSNRGLFKLLDTAGNNPATAAPDGVYTYQNLEKWISTAAPVTQAQFQYTLESAATYSSLSDPQNVLPAPTADMLKNPGNYNGDEKAVLLDKLQTAYGRLIAAQTEGIAGKQAGTNGAWYKNTLITEITKLSQDPDVVNYVTNSTNVTLQDMIQGNPGLDKILQGMKDSITDGSLLHTDLTNEPIPAGGTQIDAVPGALMKFNAVADFVNRALGTGGNSLNLDMVNIGSTADRALMRTAYQQKVANASDLDKLLTSNPDQEADLQQFGAEHLAFAPFKPWLTVPETDPRAKAQGDQAAQTAQAALVDTVTKHLLGGPDTTTDIKNIFGDADGKLDINKLNAIIKQVEAQNPRAFTDGTGALIASTKIARAFQGIWEGVVSGALLHGDLSLMGLPSYGGQTLEKVFGNGTLHAVASLLTGSVLALRSAGAKGTDVDKAYVMASAAATMANLLNASTKYARTAYAAPMGGPPGAVLDKSLELTAILGDFVGGVAGATASVYGIISGIQQINDNDKVNGTFNVVSSALYLVSNSAWVAYAGLEGTQAVGYLAAEEVSALRGSVGLLASGAGIAAALFTIVGAAVYVGINAHQKNQTKQAFLAQFDPLMKQLGLVPPINRRGGPPATP